MAIISKAATSLLLKPRSFLVMAVAFKYLLKKIYQTKTRHPGTCLTFQEVLNILIYGLAMGWSLIGLKTGVNVPLGPSPPPAFFAPLLMPCGFTSNTTMGGAPMHTSILFAPETPLNRAVVTAAAAALTIPIPGLPPTPSSSACQPAVGFESTAALLRAYITNGSHYPHSAAAAIIFNGHGLSNYTLTLSRSRLFYKGPGGERDFHWPSLDASRTAFLGNRDDTDWITSGFVSIQAAVDRAITTVSLVPTTPTGNLWSTCTVVTQTIFPTQPYASTYGLDAAIYLEFLLPLFGCIPSLTLAILLGQVRPIPNPDPTPQLTPTRTVARSQPLKSPWAVPHRREGCQPARGAPHDGNDVHKLLWLMVPRVRHPRPRLRHPPDRRFQLDGILP